MQETIFVLGELLDHLLEQGYYRMQQNMFTTSVYMGEDVSLDVFWLRTILPSLDLVQSHAIYKRNKSFTVEIKEATVTQEIEELYTLYKSNLNFDPADSVYHYLHSGEQKVQFDSKCILVRHNNQLIGVGYFDVGEKAITGIMNFYHPDYKKYSLGKYLMLLKMKICH